MKIKILRYSIQDQSTLGILTIDNKFQCYTLENSQTLIKEGIYNIKYRKEGLFNSKYEKRFKFHKGMLEIKNIKDRLYILIHTGNEANHSKGCILVGNNANNNLIKKGFIEDSTNAYVRIYNIISEALNNKEEVIIEINNI